MKAAAAVLCTVLWASLSAAETRTVDSAACERLAGSLKLPATTVTSVTAIAAGKFLPPAGTPPATASAAAALPAFCRVALTIKPTADSDIKSEVWLPLSGWNGKFQQVGNGGWGGSIQYAPLASALERGYAAASTDTGHAGDSAAFALGHPEKLIDFGYRAVHETAVQSKSAIARLYGAGPRLSYFVGCSGGGRQAFMEAQRFPADFDGIIAGAPGYNRTDQSVQLVMAAQATLAKPDTLIPPAKLAVLHRAAVKACDALDGVTDGLIAEPTRCKFDPAVLRCKAGDEADCLTAGQAEAAAKIYAGVTDPAAGRLLFPGAEPGSELNWRIQAGGPRPLGMADDMLKYVVFQDAKWDFHTLDPAKHLETARARDGGTISATSPDLKSFAKRGGRLIIYHGWADTNVSPRSSVMYHERLIATLGAKEVDAFERLYMAPGMNHCAGGEGPNVFDVLTPLERWREDGKPPAEIVASHSTSGTVDRTRPLCPYPQVARYNGSGSIDRAENFSCR
jgi:feruloyl esterase